MLALLEWPDACFLSTLLIFLLVLFGIIAAAAKGR